MDWLQVGFDRPAFLLLFLTLPAVWWFGRRSLASLGAVRYWLAIGLRSGLVVLLVLALAEVQLVRISERVAAFFLLDQSASVDRDQQRAAFAYVNAANDQHRNPAVGDMTGVIVFGAEAQIEQPAVGEGMLSLRRETFLDQRHTNIAAALRLAKASFPEGASRRVVVLSDGNQNLGDALAQASELAADGIGIDVAPLVPQALSDVVVEKITAPVHARIGVPYDVTIVLENRVPAEARVQPTVEGRLVVMRRTDGSPQLVADQPVTLPPGKSVLKFRQEQEEAAFYTYEARFVPAGATADKFAQNNQATAFTHIRGRGKVLFIVNGENVTEFDALVALLRRHDMEVTVQSTDSLFTSLSELQNYDGVVLGDVPRTSGDAADKLVRFSDSQIEMLVTNVEQFGAGLVMLGGPDSFGAGGWANTVLEDALPVDFQVKNAKVAAVGALMLVIDKSGSMNGIKLEMSKAATQAAVDMLGPNDQIGVIAFDSAAEDVVRLQKIGDRPSRIKGLIDRLGSGGGTNMDTGVRRGYEALHRTQAAIKHMIVLTDGQTEGAGYPALAARMRRENITTTTVAVGSDAAKGLLADIASQGGGKYYTALNPKVLPRIFTRETRRVVRPLIFEDAKGLAVSKDDTHEIVSGIADRLPPITGYVLTSIKESPLVEVPLTAEKPGYPNNAILAAWNYGLGRTVAFTTDAGQRWAKAWSSSEDHDKLFVQMIRWSMRSIADPGDFTVATESQDGRLIVSVNALTDDGNFLNGLAVQGSLVRDDGSGAGELAFQQIGPGRYRGETTLADAGTYLLSIFPGRGYGVLRSGVSVPYSPEFYDTSANEALLLTMAALHPKGGTRGEIIRLPEDPASWSRFLGPNVFRRDLAPARTLTAVWPLVMLIAAGLFLVDVFNRRVSVPWSNVLSALAYLARSRAAAPPSALPTLDRLKGAKRDATAFYVPATSLDAAAEAAPIVMDDSPAVRNLTAVVATSIAPETADETYSGRLLRAKREARDRTARLDHDRNIGKDAE